jgi:NhaP-type Na+/H+ or K+/H+ antiporter
MIAIIFIIIGIVVGSFIDSKLLINSNYFDTFSSAALAIGIYASVYGIDKEKLLQHIEIIFSVVTIGVIIKISIIGGLLFLITGHQLSFLIATIIAQIDPLSVASLQHKNKLSTDGKTILQSWASFDDPMTIIISLWLAMFLLVDVNSNMNDIVQHAAAIFYENIGLAIVSFIICRLLNYKYTYLVIFVVSIIISIIFELFLGLAIIALFVRPSIDDFIDKTVLIALLSVSFVTGILIASGVNIYLGILLGVLTVISQIIVSYMFTSKLTKEDKTRLSFAHQSGITAISLALYFSRSDDEIIGIISIAIIFINIFYLLSNYIIDKYIYKHNKHGRLG